MLVSMTGFGSSSYEDSSLSINIELKSFNSRYFELNTKSFDLSDVICTSIILDPKITAVSGAKKCGQWFEYPSKFSMFEKSKSENSQGYLDTQ